MAEFFNEQAFLKLQHLNKHFYDIAISRVQTSFKRPEMLYFFVQGKNLCVYRYMMGEWRCDYKRIFVPPPSTKWIQVRDKMMGLTQFDKDHFQVSLLEVNVNTYDVIQTVLNTQERLILRSASSQALYDNSAVIISGGSADLENKSEQLNNVLKLDLQSMRAESM